MESVFESFPPLTGVEEEEEGALAKLKRRLFSSSSAATTVTTSSISSAASVAASGASSELRSTSPVLSAFDSAPPTRLETARHASLSAPSKPQAPRPGPVPSSSSQPAPHHPVLPNGRRMVRPIRLSGVTPSVRLTVAHSEKGDLVQSGSSRSIAGDSGFGGDRFNVGGIHGSPTASDSFALSRGNLSSIPGFPLGRDGGDDTKSVRSVSSIARPSASVAHIFRRLRGEVSSRPGMLRWDRAIKLMRVCVRRAFRRTTGFETSRRRSALTARRCLLRFGGSIIVSLCRHALARCTELTCLCRLRSYLWPDLLF